MATTPNNPMDQPEDRQENQSTGPNPAITLLHQVWLAGLGAVAVAGRETTKVLEELIEKGREVEPDVLERGRHVSEEVGRTVKGAAQEVGSAVKSAAAKMNRGAEAAEAMLDDRVRATLERMGYATRDDVQALSAKLDSLTAKLEDLVGRRKPVEDQM